MRRTDELKRRGVNHPAVDAAFAVALVIALGVVFALDRSSSGPKPEAKVEVVQVDEEPSGEPAPPKKLRLGVTPERAELTFDNMGQLLDSLGEGYRYQTFSLDELLKPEWNPPYDVIFLTCSGYNPAWLEKQVGAGSREGTTVFTRNDTAWKQATAGLQRFVGRGGTLYASDLHFDLVADAFPEFVDSLNVDQGGVQRMTAEVTDPGLREIIGSQIPLRFDQPAWRPAAFRGAEVTAYLQGTYTTTSGAEKKGALLVKFPFKDGAVIFTSFHNEKQNSKTEVELLRYLVFAAVTAEVQSRVAKTMLRGGFSPDKNSLFSASKGAQSVTQTYQAANRGELQFVLGFENQGARLRLAVEDPSGRRTEKEGDSTVTIQIADAPAGEWKYTVTAIKLPNDNFPFTVTVGQK